MGRRPKPATRRQRVGNAQRRRQRELSYGEKACQVAGTKCQQDHFSVKILVSGVHAAIQASRKGTLWHSNSTPWNTIGLSLFETAPLASLVAGVAP